MKPSCKATHKGTCQICGSFQMLPSGVLSKHGYTTKWGFFSGVCSGSGRLPFEQSTDAIADATVAVKADINATEVEIAGYEDLSNPVNNGNNVWAQIYANREYQWVKVVLHDFVIDSTTYSTPLSKCHFSTISPVYGAFRNGSGQSATVTERIDAHNDAWGMHTLPEWARYLNRKFAKTLSRKNESRKGWLAWQKKRIAEWAPTPLTPR